jgi:integrase
MALNEISIYFGQQWPVAVHNENTEDLDGDQLSALLKAIDKSEHKQAAAMMKLALFTGMRRGEMFKLLWEDIDFERHFFTLRDPKGGQDQKIPFNAEALKIIERHPKGESPFVFPGSGGQQRTDIKKQVNAIKEAAESICSRFKNCSPTRALL